MTLRYDDDAFADVPRSELQRLVRKTEWLWSNRAVLNHTFLTEKLNPFMRWRVGDYRIIYTFDRERDHLVIRLVGHRRDVYNRAARLHT